MYITSSAFLSAGILTLLSAAIVLSNAIGLYLNAIWEHASMDGWLYNGGLLQGCVQGGTEHSWIAHFFIVPI